MTIGQMHELIDTLRSAIESVASDRDQWRELFEEEAARLNWLQVNPRRLEDVRGRVNNEGVSVRAAIDWLVKS